VTLSQGALALVDELVARKLYGESRAEVARHLVVTSLDALVEKGRLDDRFRGTKSSG
jgi:hypothetical protein